MKKDTSTIYIPTVLLTLLAYLIQTKTFFSPDVGYLLHAANQLLAGGKYGADVFETNPPMILYLYFPACLLAKFTAMSVMTAVRLYLMALVLVSLTICFFLLKKIIRVQDRALLYFLYYTLLFSMLYLPFFCFAQREHILIIFMMPYLLSAALALESKPIHRYIALLIGLMAGLGFALKPFFLVTPCLIELLFIIKWNRLFAWLRIESITIISVLVLSLFSVYYLQPDYLNIILPLVFRYYFIGMATPWYQVIIFPNVLFCVAVLFSYVFFYKHDRYRTLGTIFALALLGMIIAFMVPQTPWYYHVLPAFALALLLVADCFGQATSSLRVNANLKLLSYDTLLLLLAAGIILIFPVKYCDQLVRYIYQFQDKQPARQIAVYINEHQGPHSVACFGLGTPDCFPLVYLTNSLYGERFPFFWWHKGMRMLEKTDLPFWKARQIAKDKKTLIDYYAADLDRYKAHWVLIDTQRFQENEDKPFDVINYFLESQRFRTAWQHYRYITHIKSVSLYERAF